MSQFAKRHYEAIAQIIQHSKRDNRSVDWLANELAFLFLTDNPRFDRERFLHACKPGSNVKAKTAHLKDHGRKERVNQ